MGYQRSLSQPEEQVRQGLKEQLIEVWGFVPHLLIQERALSQLPHVKNTIASAPSDRRVDLLAYVIEQGELKPLILFECKYKKPNADALRQLFAYNLWVKAPFISLVSQGHQGLWYTQNGVCEYLGGLQHYKELCQRLKNCP
jgi:hypothetical protein